jgi:hypothetical protein
LKSILRASEITKEELVEMAVQPLIFCAFFNSTRSSPVSSDAPDMLPVLKRETPVGTKGSQASRRADALLAGRRMLDVRFPGDSFLPSAVFFQL